MYGDSLLCINLKPSDLSQIDGVCKTYEMFLQSPNVISTKINFSDLHMVFWLMICHSFAGDKHYYFEILYLICFFLPPVQCILHMTSSGIHTGSQSIILKQIVLTRLSRRSNFTTTLTDEII